jgi:hypothetical protein
VNTLYIRASNVSPGEGITYINYLQVCKGY